MKNPVKSLFNVHRPDGSPNVFVFTMPRSGSTWLMELIGTQPGFKTCSEPLNIRLPLVRKYLGATSWSDLHDPELTPRMEEYFRAHIEGRLHFLDPIPTRSNVYRFFSRRIVFKIVHGGEERIGWFRDTFNGRIVYLLRHPIAVSLSRKQSPRLDAYRRSKYRRYFTSDELRLADRIIERGTKIERGVLSWCFEHAVPLRQRSTDWIVLTYEQLVLEPEPVVDLLVTTLELPDRERMVRALPRASNVKGKSDAATQALLEHEDEASRRKLVTKWRSHVGTREESKCMELLEAFGIHAYRAGDDLPAKNYWIGDDARKA